MNAVPLVRAFSRSKMFFLLSGVVFATSVACDQTDAQASKVQAAAVPAEPAAEKAAPAAALAGEQAYDEESFALELHGPSKAKVGETVQLKVMLAAKNGFKVNAEYPVKFQFGEASGVKPAKPTLRKEDAEVHKDRFEIPLAVTLTEAGARSVGGKLSFSVCTDDRCLIEKRDLLLTIDAS